ncbi:hypothetical protein [Puniceibacterium confluentis]|uniref:hypothetical protein n=1 Tax=Puniceibacterium confluentis TaxID=1958944 RepID=UPI0011B39050|nr:hypothetical protein [Puniceibacterium confluentis]
MSKEIVQSWLDSVGDLLMQNDFEAYLDNLHLPIGIKTRGGGDWLIGDEDMLRDGFDAWVSMMHDQRATHLIRRVCDTETVANGDLWGLYTTNILKNAKPVVEPFQSAVCLRRFENGWKAVGLISGLINTQWPFALPRVAPAQDSAADATLGAPWPPSESATGLPQEPAFLQPPAAETDRK